MKCMRCGGPLHFLDTLEGLCSDNDCLIVFLSTLGHLRSGVPEFVSKQPLTQFDVARLSAKWRALYERVAKQGCLTALLAVALAACAPPDAFCVTPCGVTVVSPSPTFTCDDYTRIEGLLAERLTQYPEACTAWRGVLVEEAPGRYVEDENGAWVVGWGDCDARYIRVHVGERRMAYETSFAHELAHFAQGCAAELPVDPGLTPMHADWNRRGIYPALIETRLTMSGGVR